MAKLILSKDCETDVILGNEPGIRKIWEKVSRDIHLVTGAVCRVRNEYGDSGCQDASGSAEEKPYLARQAVIAVTLGSGSLDRQLTKSIPQLKELQGQWETYGFYLTDEPLPGIEQGLVIVGSDRLGTIYGLFRLSEMLGVTALGFWGDVKPARSDRVILTEEAEDAQEDGILQISVENRNSKEPSVKYRGFFINDEWPCFGSWTFSHFGGFTAEMYDRVFEYLLRMKGNYLWPAMWTSSFLLDGPGMASMELADEYGIYIGMSHHEPCMRSSEEWDLCKGEHTPYGTAWDYAANREGLLRYWADGLKRSRGHQVFPTIGMRGERDSKMLGEEADTAENVRILKEILTEQRRLIAENLGTDGVPLLFAVYKEVEEYYFGDGKNAGLKGFEQLDGVTLLLCEDNFGNMRALPSEEERSHPGGFGMYYHLDYHGAPVSYEWVNSTPLSKIREQMTQAWEYGVRQLWIVNAGDLKFQEYALGYFMELAWDYENNSAPGREKAYTAEWIRRQFGSFVSPSIQEKMVWALEEGVRLNGLRRPESLNDAVYHPVHYREGQRMMKRCLKLEQELEEVTRELEQNPCAKAWFSMIYFPAMSSANLLKMHLAAGLNHLYASQGKALANVYGEMLDACIKKDEELAGRMAAFAGGKWSGMEKAFHIGFRNWNGEDWRYPVRHVVRLPKTPRLVVSRTDREEIFTNQYFPKPLEIEDFPEPGETAVSLQIANGGQGKLVWRIEGSSPFLEFSARAGETETAEEVVLFLRRDRIPAGETAVCSFFIRAGDESVPVAVKAGNPAADGIPKGSILEQDGLLVLDAADFWEKQGGSYAGEACEFERLEDFGKYGSGMKVSMARASFEGPNGAPCLRYRLWAQRAGSRQLYLHTSPANPLRYGGRLRLGVSVNGSAMKTAFLTDEDYRGGDHTCAKWAQAVLDQEHVGQMQVMLREGENILCLYAQDAGLAIERLVLCAPDGRVLPSYLGPEKSMKI